MKFQGSKFLISENPGDLLDPIGEMAFSKDAVPAAVDAASKAFTKWSSLGQNDRFKYFLKFQKVLRAHKNELALLITKEMGKILSESEAEVDRIIAKINNIEKYELSLIRSSSHDMEGELQGHLRFRPRGVMAVLAPFNLPAHLACSPCLSVIACGNTVILKPSELTPFVGRYLAYLWQKAGLPKGVFNLVQGPGEVGEALVKHPGVNGVIFTGSWPTGDKIQRSVLEDPGKICALEMGGKNSAIVLRDCDLESAVKETFTGAYLTTGQRCNATGRILVQRSIAKKFISLFLKKVDTISVGYGTDPGVFMGPMASKKGFEKYLSYLKKAPKEGFETLSPGGPISLKKKGYYLKPSAHLLEGQPRFAVKDGCYSDDEIFGPDAAIYIVKNIEEALCINNRPRFGLVVSLFSRSKKNYDAVLRGAENGLINWNVSTVRSSGQLPFGGLKRSGNNRPVGSFSPYLCTIPTASLEKSL